MATNNPNPLLQALKDAVFAGMLTLLVLGPITGLVLSGYDYNTHFERPLMLAGIVAALRFVFTLLSHSDIGQSLFQKFGPRKDGGVLVRHAHEMGKTKYIIPVVILIGLLLPFIASKYILSVVISALIYVLLGLGLNIVVGLAGLLDLGFVAFYAVGAYVMALGAQNFEWINFWTAIPLAAAIAALCGAILGFPVLRMHGDYLAIVTLGFGEIIRLVLNNWTEVTGGPNGARAPSPTFFGLEFTRRAKEGGIPIHEYLQIDYNSAYKYMFIYIVLFIIVCLMVMFVNRLRRMPMGRAWEALREDEIACRSLGINHVGVKLTAFMMGAMTGGIAGVFFAAYQGFINPSSFTFFESALILAIVVLGGLGSIPGVIVAALLITIIPELAREFADYRLLVFGMTMVLMMIWRPRGLLRIIRPAYNRGERS